MRFRFSLVFAMFVVMLACTPICAAQTCATAFATVDRSSDWTRWPCHCFDKVPRGTKVYLVGQYQIVEGNSTAYLPPETVFTCGPSGLSYVRPGSPQREHVPPKASVTYVRAAVEMVMPAREAHIRLQNGTAVLQSVH